MKRIAAWWDRCWFSYSDRYQYGIFRMMLIAGLFGIRGAGEWRLETFHHLIWAPPAINAPIPLFHLLHIPVPPPLGWYGPVEWTFRVALVFSFFGILTRPSLIVLAALNLYIQGTLNSFGMIDHATTIPSIVLAVMAIAPGVTEYSIDHWIMHRRSHRTSWPVWPAHLILMMMGLAYFGSGYSKMVKSRGAWIDGWTLTSYLLDAPNAQLLMPPTAARAKQERARIVTDRVGVPLESFVYDTGRPTWLGILITRWHPVIAVLSTLTVLWELTFILTLFFPRLRTPYLVAGVGFHGGIMTTLMLYSFYSFLVCYLLFVDWAGLWKMVTSFYGKEGGRRVGHMGKPGYRFMGRKGGSEKRAPNSGARFRAPPLPQQTTTT